MSKVAILEFEGNKYELPTLTGSENETAVDISKLRDQSGLITMDPGYKNSGVCKSEITFLDGEEGILRYRGYAIEDLADKAGFLEVSYLVIFGDLPTSAQLSKFETELTSNHFSIASRLPQFTGSRAEALFRERNNGSAQVTPRRSARR